MNHIFGTGKQPENASINPDMSLPLGEPRGGREGKEQNKVYIYNEMKRKGKVFS